MSRSKVSVDPTKMEVVMKWSRPTSIIEVCSFLELTGFYRRFVHDIFKIALPLIQLTRNGSSFVRMVHVSQVSRNLSRA